MFLLFITKGIFYNNVCCWKLIFHACIFSKNNDKSLTMLRTINREKLSPANYWTIFTMSVFYELNCIRKICRRAEKLGGDKPSRSVSNEVKIQGFLQQRISINCNRFCYLWAFFVYCFNNIVNGLFLWTILSNDHFWVFTKTYFYEVVSDKLSLMLRYKLSIVCKFT